MIGIITFHTAINYGGVLQAFALQEALCKLGASVEIIDYHCPYFEKQYLYTNESILRKIKRIIHAIKTNGILKRNIVGFTRFRKEYLHLSAEYNDKNISDTNKIYDSFITGSDQVWSPICAGFDKHYFLDFVDDNKKKNSYAASFGQSNISDEQKKTYRSLLSGFNKISVREESGVLLVQNIIKRNCVCVVDPTFLLSKIEWANYIAKVRYPKFEYVLVYMIEEDKNLLRASKKYAESHGLDVIYINDRILKYPGVKNLKNVDPDEWAALFYHAKRVYTNSFHGVAFSLNFNIPFTVQYLPSNHKVGDRITNLLETFDLMETLNIDLEDDYIFDFDIINSKISKLRMESLDYLISIMENSSYGK